MRRCVPGTAYWACVSPPLAAREVIGKGRGMHPVLPGRKIHICKVCMVCMWGSALDLAPKNHQWVRRTAAGRHGQNKA